MNVPYEMTHLARLQSAFTLRPLAGGMAPHLSWASLRPFEADVLPYVTAGAPAVACSREGSIGLCPAQRPVVLERLWEVSSAVVVTPADATRATGDVRRAAMKQR